MTLKTALLTHSNKIRFHMPGHRGDLDASLLRCDTTELFYSGNLLAKSGVLADLEDSLAKSFKTDSLFISTQGATGSIFQAVFARRGLGAFLIVGDAHSSVYNALRAFKQKAYKTDALKDIPSDVKTVIFTAPNYLGELDDIESTCEALRKKGIVTIVDQAHGAHFCFSGLLPKSAVQFADLTILSLHKTMPVLTGGAVLCAKKDFAAQCDFARKNLHSTSPSYPIIVSIEDAVRDFTVNGLRYYYDLKNKIDFFKFSLKKPFSVCPAADFSRLVIKSDFDGQSVYDFLSSAGIIADTCVNDKVVFVVTPFNMCHLELLCRILNEAPVSKFAPYACESYPDKTGTFELKFDGETEFVPLEKAVGRVCMTEAGLYPPSTPLIYSGEKITEECVRLLTKNAERRFGLVENKLCVLK